ncbi:MAG: prepilin peptidase [Patescibacteria group bacterium]|nr:prepilin peptidase [Patescibacteria group bacterium]
MYHFFSNFELTSLLTYCLVLAFGACVGSFLNVVIDRFPAGQSILGRSRSDCCARTLGVWDLIPILSFMFSRGRCRYCNHHLSFYYPLVEASAAILTLIFYLIFPLPHFVFYAVNGYFLIIYFFMDLKYGLVSSAVFSLNIFFTVSCLLYLLYRRELSLAQMELTAVSGFILALFFLFLILMTRGRGMGLGDILLVLALSLFLGFPLSLVMIFLSFFLGGLASIFLLLLGKKKIGQTVPFGPFLTLSSLLALFWGNVLINFYLRYLLG